MTTEEIIAYQASEKDFGATPIGAAFLRFKNAYAKAWVSDTEDGMSDRNRKSTMEAWEKAAAAERELRALLSEDEQTRDDVQQKDRRLT